MKKLFLVLISSVLFITSTNAQNIKEGNFYFGTRMTGADFSFSDKTYVGLSVDGGYFIFDSWAIGGVVGVNHYDSETGFSFLANTSYYFLETGMGALFGRFGIGADRELGLTSFIMDLTAGYSLFIKENISIEPTAGFLIPFKSGRDVSFNLGVGFSLYF